MDEKSKRWTIHSPTLVREKRCAYYAVQAQCSEPILISGEQTPICEIDAMLEAIDQTGYVLVVGARDQPQDRDYAAHCVTHKDSDVVCTYYFQQGNMDKMYVYNQNIIVKNGRLSKMSLIYFIMSLF